MWSGIPPRVQLAVGYLTLLCVDECNPLEYSRTLVLTQHSRVNESNSLNKGKTRAPRGLGIPPRCHRRSSAESGPPPGAHRHACGHSTLACPHRHRLVGGLRLRVTRRATGPKEPGRHGHFLWPGFPHVFWEGAPGQDVLVWLSPWHSLTALIKHVGPKPARAWESRKYHREKQLLGDATVSKVGPAQPEARTPGSPPSS